MGRTLSGREWRMVSVGMILAGFLSVSPSMSEDLSARKMAQKYRFENHSGVELTGYAFGRATSASGILARQGYAANHPCILRNNTWVTTCGDPSSCWNWGTRYDLSNPSVVYFRNGTNQVKERTKFKLYENGDYPGCEMDPYWIDLYHGRWVDPPENVPIVDVCSCPGVAGPGFCMEGFNGVNNCDNAKAFGLIIGSYRARIPNYGPEMP